VHGGLSVALPNAELVPGRRVVEVTNIASGLPAGIGSIALTVAPVAVSAGGALQAGQPVTLQAAHVLADGVVNFLGVAVAYTRLTPTSVRAVVPAGVAAHGGEDIPVSITSGTATGSPTNLAVAP
jgi:hypothetical protein